MSIAHTPGHSRAGEDVSFRHLCATHGITVTHQRQVLFEVMQGIPGHPSPEEVYARVQERIPSISLATVYKNIHLFIASGLFREVSMHHGSLRVEMNDRPHLDEDQLGGLPQPHRLPNGFVAERYSVDVLGFCAKCQDVDQTVDQKAE